LSGFDTTSAVLQFALGETPELGVEHIEDRHVLLEFFNFTPGTVRDVTIDPRVPEDAFIFHLNLAAGDEVSSARDSRFRPGYFAVAASSLKELRSKGEHIRQGVHIEYA
jgi:L-amino acid ligase C-terminal domain 2